MTSYLNNIQTSHCRLNSGIYILGKFYALEDDELRDEWLYVRREDSQKEQQRRRQTQQQDNGNDTANIHLHSVQLKESEPPVPEKAAIADEGSTPNISALSINGGVAQQANGGTSYMSYFTSFFSSGSASIPAHNDPLAMLSEEQNGDTDVSAKGHQSTNFSKTSQQPQDNVNTPLTTTVDSTLTNTNSIMKEHLKNDILSRLYFSYRKSIPDKHRIGGRYTSDKGWGCLIRSGQMLMGETLIRLYLGRMWRKNFVSISESENIIIRDGSEGTHLHTVSDKPHQKSTESNKSKQKKKRQSSDPLTEKRLNQKRTIDMPEYEANQIALYHYVLRQFFDEPSAPYSIQNICQCGEDKYSRKVGEWFAPTTIAYVLKDLLEHNNIETQLSGAYVCDQSVIFLDQIEQRFASTSNATRKFSKYNTDFVSRIDQSHSDLNPFLILLPVKLGIQKINPVYHDSIHKVLDCPHSVGIAGGRRHHSLYFIGHKESGPLIFFDPHTTQNASHDPESYHFPYGKTGLRCIKLSHVDPSMLIGFLIRNREEFDSFNAYAEKHFCGSENPILSIMPTKPCFELKERTVTLGDGGVDDEWLSLSAADM
uniref:Cysteine protease n=1 Tax=Percolomonas cosmopolitus TaxID=63605 RepID=A0A7S1KU47_9EUKA